MPPNVGSSKLAGLDDFVRVVRVQLDVEDVDVGEAFEQHALAFHHRLAGQCADVAQSEHGRAVADHGDQVPFRRVAKCIEGVLFDFETGYGDARRVGQAQIALGAAGLAGNNLNFTRPSSLMVVECFLLSNGHDGLQMNVCNMNLAGRTARHDSTQSEIEIKNVRGQSQVGQIQDVDILRVRAQKPLRIRRGSAASIMGCLGGRQ